MCKNPFSICCSRLFTIVDNQKFFVYYRFVWRTIKFIKKRSRFVSKYIINDIIYNVKCIVTIPFPNHYGFYIFDNTGKIVLSNESIEIIINMKGLSYIFILNKLINS